MILRHRRLLLLSAVALLSVFFAQALPHRAKAFLFWFLLSATVVFAVLSFIKHGLITATLALLLATLAVFSSYQVSSKEQALLPYDGRTLSVSATVFTVTSETEEGIRGEGEIRFFTEDGEEISARVRISAPVSAVAGHVLYGVAVFSLPEDTYTEAAGLCGTVTFRTCRTVDRLYGPRYAVGELRDMLTERIRAAVPGEEGGLLCALLLGVRDGLSDTFTRDMTRIGTTHILSLSGLHLTILTEGLGALLRRLRLGKRLRLGLLALFAVSFMIFTGLSTTVMRAGLMLLFSALPVFLREERDSLSSLGAAVAVICLLEPYAVKDVSLWFSALSTLGILLLFDRLRRREAESYPPLWRRLLRAVCLSLSVTAAATVATLPLTLTRFGTVPLLSPIANLLLGPLAQIAIYLALVIALLGDVAPISFLAKQICTWIIALARLLSDVPKTVLSPPSEPAFILSVSLAVCILLYFLLCPRKHFRFLVPVLLSLTLLLTAVLPPVAARIARGDRLSLTYATVEDEATDCLYFERGGERLMIVFSDFEGIGAAEKIVLDQAAGELDGFLLPYYTDGTASYVETLLNTQKVRLLYLPSPESAAERALYDEILTIAKGARVPTTAFPRTEAFFFGSLTVSRLYAVSGGRSVDSVSAEILFGYTRLQYYSANGLNAVWQKEAARADVLILGRYRMPQIRRFDAEGYMSDGTVVLCSAPYVLPFQRADGIAFSPVRRILLE